MPNRGDLPNLNQEYKIKTEYTMNEREKVNSMIKSRK